MRSMRSGQHDVQCMCLSSWAWHVRSPEGGALSTSRGSACGWSLSRSAGHDAHMYFTMHAQHALRNKVWHACLAYTPSLLVHALLS